MESFGFSRKNCFAAQYVEIAAKNFLIAERLLNEFQAYTADAHMKKDEFNYGEIDNHTITAGVFSALAIESYINDYSCRIMGDDFYYDNFQSLSTIAKLQLCYRIVTGNSIDKGTSTCYSLLKQLTKLRNDYVHNKSSFCPGLSKEEIAAYNNAIGAGLIGEPNYHDVLDSITIDLRSGLLQSYHAIRTVFELSRLIDSIDENAFAELFLFGGNASYGISESVKTLHRRFLDFQ